MFKVGGSSLYSPGWPCTVFLQPQLPRCHVKMTAHRNSLALTSMVDFDGGDGSTENTPDPYNQKKRGYALILGKEQTRTSL